METMIEIVQIIYIHIYGISFDNDYQNVPFSQERIVKGLRAIYLIPPYNVLDKCKIDCVIYERPLMSFSSTFNR